MKATSCRFGSFLAQAILVSCCAMSLTTPIACGQGRRNPADEVIPIIVMESVELVDAVKNLARMAELNYVLDPKVPYGGVDGSGRPKPQPMVSLRWQNITARQAIVALLDNYDLVLVEDTGTSTARITVRAQAATNSVTQGRP